MIYTLREWQTLEKLPETLTERDRRLASRLKGITLDEMRDGLRVKATSRVGVVRFDSFTLQIKPKFSQLDLLKMILFATGLERLMQRLIQRDLEAEAEGSIFDLIALVFAEACERVARDGLLHNYLMREEALPVVRGRLLADRQVLQHFGQIDRLECRYDDHVANVVENQILLSALMFCRQRVEQPHIKRLVERLYTLFGSVCDPLQTDWRQLRDTLTYNRLNGRYREAHTLAWLILEGFAIRDLLAVGRLHGYAFLIDMNRLFEAFVTRLIRLAMPKYRIHSQKHVRAVIWDVDQRHTYASIIPDILVETHSGCVLAIDAKYKPYNRKSINNHDIYQTFLYAYAYRHTDRTPAALLVYPSDRESGIGTRLEVRDRQLWTQARIQALGVHIPQALRELEVGQGELCTIIKESVLHLLGECGRESVTRSVHAQAD